MQQLVTTAGHVDHGKSTLVRALTGHDPDRWEEERVRGLTIDLGFEWTTRHRLERGRFGAPARGEARTWDRPDDLVFFVDVPGHHRFIDNLLTAMVDARYVLLVVSAVEGWSEGTQTHVDILHALGVDHGLVAVSRANDPSARACDDLVSEIEEWLADTSLAGIPVAFVDSELETGLVDLVDRLLQGLTLVPEARRGRARLWVDRSFSIRGAGTVVTGQLEGEALEVGDVVRVAPRDEEVPIKALHVAGQPVTRAEPGLRVAVNLRGLAPERVVRGCALVAPSGGAHPTARSNVLLSSDIDAQVVVTSPVGVQSRGAWTVHIGTAKVTARLSLVGSPSAEAGETVYARLRLAQPQPLLVGDRFLLWDSGRTGVAGGGIVLHTEPSGRRRRIPAAERARLLRAIDPQASRADVAASVLEADGGWRAWNELAWLADLPARDLDGVCKVGDWAVSVAMRDRLRDAAIAAVVEHPRSSRETLIAGVSARVPGLPTDLVQRVLDQLVSEGILARVDTEYVTPSEVDAVVAERADRVSELVARLGAGGLEPPDLEALRRELGLSGTELANLAAAGTVIVSEDLGFVPEHVNRALARLSDAFGEEWFAVTEARQLLDVRRRYALALLYAMDRMRATELRADGLRRVRY